MDDAEDAAFEEAEMADWVGDQLERCEKERDRLAEILMAERDSWLNDSVALLTRLTEVELDRDRLAGIVDAVVAWYVAEDRYYRNDRSPAAEMDAQRTSVELHRLAAAEVERRG